MEASSTTTTNKAIDTQPSSTTTPVIDTQSIPAHVQSTAVDAQPPTARALRPARSLRLPTRIQPSRSTKDIGKDADKDKHGKGVDKAKPGKDVENVKPGKVVEKVKPDNKSKNKKRKAVGATETVGDLEVGVDLQAGSGSMIAGVGPTMIRGVGAVIPGVGAPMTLQGVRGSMTPRVRDVLAENVYSKSKMYEEGCGGDLGGAGSNHGGVEDPHPGGVAGVESAAGISDVTNLGMGNGGYRVIARAGMYAGATRGPAASSSSSSVYAVVGAVVPAQDQEDEVAAVVPAPALPAVPVAAESAISESVVAVIAGPQTITAESITPASLEPVAVESIEVEPLASAAPSPASDDDDDTKRVAMTLRVKYISTSTALGITGNIPIKVKRKLIRVCKLSIDDDGSRE